MVDTSDPQPCVFTWAQDVVPYLAHGISVLPGAGLSSYSFNPENGPLPAPIVGIASTPTGNGYWLVDSQGYVTAYGDAMNYGGMDGVPLNAAISHIVSTPTGAGYWLVATDGGIFSFGNAQFYGSMGGTHLNASVNGGSFAQGGYRMVATDGGIFSFGDAQFYGSTGGDPPSTPVVGMAVDDATGGYWIVDQAGQVFDYNAPVVAAAP